MDYNTHNFFKAPESIVIIRKRGESNEEYSSQKNKKGLTLFLSRSV